MQEIRITQDAELMLYVLYEAYTVRRKNGMSRSEACDFGSSQKIQEEYLQQWPIADIDNAAGELKGKGLFDFFNADDTVYAQAQLTNDGITYMEHRFGDKFDVLIKRIAELRAAILG